MVHVKFKGMTYEGYENISSTGGGRTAQFVTKLWLEELHERKREITLCFN
jgi:hypothetical protein